MGRKKVSTTVYLTADQAEELRLLGLATKVPQAEFVRQGVELVLARERAKARARERYADALVPDAEEVLP